MDLKITLRTPHAKQAPFVNSLAKRMVIRAGRRGGKTTGVATRAVKAFLAGRRVLYGVPTDDQVERFWFEVKRALVEPLATGLLYKNETKHIIEFPNTEQRIRAKTAWNADTLRGDFADELILDEYQMMKSEAWEKVGAPMLLDNDGNATFVYTSKRGARHAQELYEKAKADTTGRWAFFRFTSHDNPHLSSVALDTIASDMTDLTYRMEILAEDIIDDPDALWKRQEMIEVFRVVKHPELVRVVVGVDPPGSKRTECGIVAAGLGVDQHGYILSDKSLFGSPNDWGRAVVTCYHLTEADRVLGEANYGGDMVESTIRTVDDRVSYSSIHATRGKLVRAEPVAALYEQGRVHHVGDYPELEDEYCSWKPGDKSPNRLDAAVWALTELMLGKAKKKVAVWR